MSLMPVEASPTLRMISKAEKIDPDGTHELVRLALYETLCDQIDAARPALSRAIESDITKRTEIARRTLVKQYVAKRQRGEDVEEVLKAAAEMTLLEKSAATEDDPRTPKWDARDLLGRFARRTGKLAGKATESLQAADAVDGDDRYRGMRATGAGLAALTGNSTATAVAGAATALGGLGPEAEKVLGQGLRRTSYRYRGSEKRPDKGLKDDIKSGLAMVRGKQDQVDAVVGGYRDEAATARALGGKPFDKDRSSVRAREGVSPSVEVADFWRKKGLSGDQKEMNVAGDLAAHYYLNKLPSPEATAISIAAGRVPPSQGVIIDADGDIISEAMGVNGDHYLPFDLKNLRSLNGGQYVRTRATGGPTTEDIYTGLLTGARQVQVVSSSGVFTLEFDPELRGGRRYSDKARQMVGRYQRILDAIDQSHSGVDPKTGIKGSGLYQNDLTSQEKREIYQRLSDRYSGVDLETVAEQEISRLREQKSFQMLTEDEIDAEARQRLKKEPNANRARLAELRKEVQAENRAESVKRFRLDGDGYEAALKALQTEFPYFVRAVRREPLPDFVNNRNLQAKTSYSGATDRGYVSPKTASSALARSVTYQDKATGRVEPRGAYDAPARRGGKKDAAPGTDTSETSEGGTAASGATPAAPKGDFKALVNERPAKRLADSAMSDLAVLADVFTQDSDNAPALVKPDFGINIQGDYEFKNMPPAKVLFAVAERAAKHGDALDYLANQAGPNEKRKLRLLLSDFPGFLKKERLQGADETVASAQQLLTVLNAVEPFAPGDSPVSYDPEDEGKVPMRFDDIAQLGMDKSRYEAFESAILPNEDLRKIVEKYDRRGDDLQNFATEDIKAYLEDYEATDEKDTTERERIAAEAELAQRAFAYTFAKRSVENYHKLIGKEWTKVGKALGGPSVAARRSQPRPFQKRHVSWHRSGTEVADALQKLLASAD